MDVFSSSFEEMDKVSFDNMVHGSYIEMVRNLNRRCLKNNYNVFKIKERSKIESELKIGDNRLLGQ